MTASVDLTAWFTQVGNGVHWTLETPSQLNANLVRLDPGQSMGEHVNHEVDVLVVVVHGSGVVQIDHETIELLPLSVVHVAAGTQRRIEAGPEGLWYLTVHRRRTGPSLGPTRTGPTN